MENHINEIINVLRDDKLYNNDRVNILDYYLNDIDTIFYIAISKSNIDIDEQLRLIKQFNLIYLQIKSITKQLKNNYLY